MSIPSRLGYLTGLFTLARSEMFGDFKSYSESRDAKNVAAWDRVLQRHCEKDPYLGLLKTADLLNQIFSINSYSTELRKRLVADYGKLLQETAKKDLLLALSTPAENDHMVEQYALSLCGFLDKIFESKSIKGMRIAANVLQSERATPEQKDFAATQILRNISTYEERYRAKHPETLESNLAVLTCRFLEDILEHGTFSDPSIMTEALKTWRDKMWVAADKRYGGDPASALQHIDLICTLRLSGDGEKTSYYHEAVVLWKDIICDLAKRNLGLACDIAAESCRSRNAPLDAPKSNFRLCAEVIRNDFYKRFGKVLTKEHIKARRELRL